MADKAHKLTDDKLEVMERHLSAIYSRAQKEISKTADDYFKKFEKQDEAKHKLMEQGKITEEEYTKWRKGKILYGKRYTEMKENIAKQLMNVNKTAMAYINGELPAIYALNYNDIANMLENIKDYTFTLTDTNTVKNLATKDKTLLPYKEVDGKKDIRWNTKKVNSEVLQGVLQGDSMPKIAKRLQRVTEMNRTSAIRNARTSVTSAENKGRFDSYKQAETDGIILKKEWLATRGNRTRDWHASLDGVQEEIDTPFTNEYGEIMYPGDPNAHPANVYNCRCTMVVKVVGFKKGSD